MKTNKNTIAVYQEIQELAASYFICGIPVCIIETCYQKYFMRSLDYHSLGVRNIDELLERMGDMVVVFEERESNGKYVMPALMVQIRRNQLKHYVQKLLDSHDGKIVFNNFEDLYKDRFKLELEYRFYALSDLDNLCEILKDILVVGVAEPSGEKVINAVKWATMLVLSRDTVKADIYFVWAPAATNETSATKLQTLP
ncbi:endonuclease [Tanacetum coccineum]